MNLLFRFFLAVALSFVFFAQSVHAVPYSIVDLSTLGGTKSLAFDVNIHGDVVGSSTVANGQTHAFLYQGGVMTDLGVLNSGHTISEAYGINDSGQVVGISTNLQNNFFLNSRPFLFSGGSMSLVGSFGGNYGWANDINNAGHIVGISAYSNGVPHAFVKAFGTMIDLGSYSPTTFDYSIAYGINDTGSVAGYSTTSQNFSEAFLHHNTLQNLGNLGGSSRGFSVNDSNSVTGASVINASGDERAFLWQNGVMTDLGVTGAAITSQGLDINNLGHVVGTLVFDKNDGTKNHGFLYSNSTMIDVNSLLPQNSGWVLREAQAINDVGQIVGFGVINGQEHAYLLSPVPEPSTLFLFAIGAISLLGRRRR